MKIKVIGPNSARSLPAGALEARQETLRRYASPGTEISLGFTDAPPHLGGWAGLQAGRITEASVESIAPFIAKAAMEAERDGFDGVFLTGQVNVGAGLTRHVVNIPVVDSATATLHLAALLGDRIGILHGWTSTRPYIRRLLRRWGLSDYVVSLRSFDQQPDRTDLEGAKAKAIGLAKAAVEDDDAEVIAAFCGPWIPMTVSEAEIQAAIGVPVLNSWASGLKMTELFINLGLSTSRKSHPFTDINFLDFGSESRSRR